MLTFNNKILTVSNKGLEVAAGPTPPPGPTFDEVTIGNQTWMAKNLAIDDGGEGIKSYDISYDGGQTYVTEYYYTVAAAQRIAATISGWHVPSDGEYDTLIAYIGSDPSAKIRATYGWANGGGLDTYGFAALPAGRWLSSSSKPYPRDNTVGYFMSTGEDAGVGRYHYIVDDSQFTWQRMSYDYLVSVRLVKDA